MKIKRLELSGFKSFVYRTVVKFDRAVMGIVGHNGCGKSNIVDAIRWCMGEQSAKNLRGRSMDDVIFSGSETRPGAEFAEVTLTFENDNDGADLPIEYKDYAEIAITRRLHRSGESEYLINKTQVRLKDVTDLFLGTGVGTKAYSIIEQGKIGLIVSAKAEDRRLLIEEAAGITKFKSKRKQAEKKMEMTQQNLLRVGDITPEIDRNLGSLNLGMFVRELADGTTGVDYDHIADVVRLAVRYLDRVVDINFYPTEESGASNSKWRPVGLGLMGLQDVFFKLKLPFDSPEARAISARISEEIYYNALWASTELAEASGPHENFAETRAANGELQMDLWGVTPSDPERWQGLRDRVAAHGLRNSLLIAIAPTATIASIAGCYECIEPQVSNLFKRETLSGEFLQINAYLVRDLQSLGLWNDRVISAVKKAEGSIQDIEEIPAELRAIYRTAWELPMRSLIDMAAERGPYIDQSQSLNLFVESPTIGKLSSMYAHAWKSGLKTTYYMRSRPATRINKTTTAATVSTTPPAPTGGGVPAGSSTEAAAAPAAAPKKTFTEDEALACSLENPESCEACQ